MTPPVSPKNQTPFGDEISLLDIIQFFKVNFKRMFLFIVMGGILGYLYGKLADPVYEGTALISLPSVNGKLFTDPKTTLIKLNMNSYFTKENFLACNGKFHEDTTYNEIDIKKKIAEDGKLIKLMKTSSNKETIRACFESVTSTITAQEGILVGPMIELKKNELDFFEEKLKFLEFFQIQLKEEQMKNLKKNGQQNSKDMLNAIMSDHNAMEIKIFLEQINRIKIELLPGQTNFGGMLLDMKIQRRKFPSPEFGMLLGLFLGGILGFFVSYVRNMKIN
jgi:hypothetical protein